MALAAAFGATLLVTRTASAGGLEVGDSGGEAMGRGGAFVAKADGPSALVYNPAGLAKLRGFRDTLALDAIDFQSEFTRSGGDYPTVRNQKPWFMVPQHIVLSYDFGLPSLAVAAGYYAPTAPSNAYGRTVTAKGVEAPAPQRYDSVSGGTSILLFPSLGVGFRLASAIDFGLTFQWAVTQIKMLNISRASSACPDSREDPACDISIRLNAKDTFAPTGSAGVLLRPTDALELGAMVRLPSKSKLSGKATIELGPAVRALEASMSQPLVAPQDPHVTITNDTPWMVRAGGRYVFGPEEAPTSDIELDLTYERWSAASKKNIIIDATSAGKPLAPIVADWKLKDTYGARLGASHVLRPTEDVAVTVRAGAFYESETTAVSDTSLGVFGPQRMAATVGLGVRLFSATFDVAYAHFFVPRRVVSHSTLTARELGGGTAVIVGNGTYRASVDGIYAQLTFAWGVAGNRWRGAPGGGFAPGARPIPSGDLRGGAATRTHAANGAADGQSGLAGEDRARATTPVSAAALEGTPPNASASRRSTAESVAAEPSGTSEGAAPATPAQEVPLPAPAQRQIETTTTPDSAATASKAGERVEKRVKKHKKHVKPQRKTRQQP